MSADVGTPATSTWQSKKRKNLTAAQKDEIYQFHKDNPLVTHGNIAAIFGVERSTVSKIVHQSNGDSQPTKITDNASKVEAQLMNWVHEARRSGLNVTRDMIRAQAALLATRNRPSPGRKAKQTPEAPKAAQSETRPSTPAFGCDMSYSYSNQATTPESFFDEQDLDFFTNSGDGAPMQDVRGLHQNSTSTSSTTSLAHMAQGSMQNGSLYDTFGLPGLSDPSFGSEAPPLSRCVSEGMPRSGEYSHATMASGVTSPRSSSIHQTFIEPMPGQPNMYNTMMGYDHLPVTPPHSNDGGQGLLGTTTQGHPVDSVYLQEVQRAFAIVDDYVSRSLAKTPLDQLCLNHVKSCLSG